MAQEIEFKSQAMINIMKREGLSKEDAERELFNVNIDGNKLDLQGNEYELFIEDIQGLKEILSEGDISQLKISNIDLREKQGLLDAIANLSKDADGINIENVQFDNAESAFKQIYGDNNINSIVLRNQQEISKFMYDKYNKKMIIDSQSIQFLDEYKKFVDAKSLVVQMESEQSKNDIIDNIDILRESQRGTIILSDVSKDRNIQDLKKFENYANGNNVLFKSDVLKQSMGIDRLPTSIATMPGISYNVGIRGQKLGAEDKFKLEGEQLEIFLNDLVELSKNCSISNIAIGNIEIPEGTDLSKLSKAFSNVEKIEIRDSQIPGLKEIINNIPNKDKLTHITLENSGLAMEDIDSKDLINLEELRVTENENGKLKNKDILEKDNPITTITPTIDYKLPWYKRVWDRVKQLPGIKKIFDNKVKALPEANIVRNEEQNIPQPKKESKKYINSLKVSSSERLEQAELNNNNFERTEQKEQNEMDER